MKTMIGAVEALLKERGLEVFVTYTRDEHRTPHTCVVHVFDEGNPLRNGGRPLAVGESKCHPKDNFWKKKGRHIAVCRAAKQLGVI